MRKDSEDLEEIEEEENNGISPFRKFLIFFILIIVLLGALLFYIFFVRDFKIGKLLWKVSNSNTSSIETQSGDSTLEAFSNGIIKISRQGLMYYDEKGDLIWSKNFNILDLQYDICGTYIAICDRGTNSFYQCDSRGNFYSGKLEGKVRKAVTTVKGISYYLSDNENDYYILEYSYDGNLMGKKKYSYLDCGYVCDFDVSKDGDLIIISYADINDLKVSCKIKFISTADMSEQVMDTEYYLEDALVGFSSFISNDASVALYDGGAVFFNNLEPKKSSFRKAYTEDKEIQGVAIGDSIVGLLTSSVDEGKNRIVAINKRGIKLFARDVDANYTDFSIVNDYIILHNDSKILIYSKYGFIRYEGSPASGIKSLIIKDAMLNKEIIIDSSRGVETYKLR